MERHRRIAERKAILKKRIGSSPAKSPIKSAKSPILRSLNQQLNTNNPLNAHTIPALKTRGLNLNKSEIDPASLRGVSDLDYLKEQQQLDPFGVGIRAVRDLRFELPVPRMAGSEPAHVTVKSIGDGEKEIFKRSFPKAVRKVQTINSLRPKRRSTLMKQTEKRLYLSKKSPPPPPTLTSFASVVKALQFQKVRATAGFQVDDEVAQRVNKLMNKTT